jgi:hypothetical protein
VTKKSNWDFHQLCVRIPAQVIIRAAPGSTLVILFAQGLKKYRALSDITTKGAEPCMDKLKLTGLNLG